MYLLHHEEIESLAKTHPLRLQRIRFFMTFVSKLSDPYELSGKCRYALHRTDQL